MKTFFLLQGLMKGYPSSSLKWIWVNEKINYLKTAISNTDLSSSSSKFYNLALSFALLFPFSTNTNQHRARATVQGQVFPFTSFLNMNVYPQHTVRTGSYT